MFGPPCPLPAVDPARLDQLAEIIADAAAQIDAHIHRLLTALREFAKRSFAKA